MRQQHWLDLLEYLFIAIAIVAIVPTAITGQPLYAIVPLISILGLNRLNRDRFGQTIAPVYQLIEQGGIQEIRQHRETQRLHSDRLSALTQNYQILQVQASEHEQLKQQLVSLAQQLVQYETLAEEAIATTQQQVDTAQESLLQRLNQLELRYADFGQQIQSELAPLYQLIEQGGVQEIQQHRETQRLQSDRLSALTQNYQILQVQASEHEQLKQQLVSLAQQLVQYETLAEEAIAKTQQQVDTTQESLLQRLNQLELRYAELGEQIQSEVEAVKEAIAQFTLVRLCSSPETATPEANVTPPEPTVEEIDSFVQNGSQDDSTSPQPPRSEDFIADLQDNYHRLRDLLATGQWLQADRETKVLMLKACGKSHETKLDTDTIAHFPCKDLWTIDRLWLYYSQGRFGFTVQKQIYDAVGKDYSAFGDRIQWQVNHQWKNYADLNFSLNTAPGHLPLGALITDTSLGWFGFEWASLFARMEKCQVAAKI